MSYILEYTLDAINKYNSIDWNYGILNNDFKALYTIDMIERIYYEMCKNKVNNYNYFILIYNEINKIYKFIINNNCKRYNNIDNIKIIKYKFMKYLKKHNYKFKENEKEFIDTMIKNDPVFTILKYKTKSKTLIKIPTELIIMIDNYI